MAQVTELITEFKFKGSSAPLGKYNASLGKGIGLLAGMTAALAGSAAAVAMWTTNVLGGEQSLINLSAETGVAAGRIQELQYIAEVSNSTAGALSSSMGGLARKIGEAAQQGSEDFARLGISVRGANGEVKDADAVLGEVGNRFKQLGLSMSEQQSFAEKLGIDPSLITMMGRTAEEMGALSARARELGTLTEEQVAFAQEYNDSMTNMKFAIDGVKRLVAVGLGPEIKKLTEGFTDLITENKDWIINGAKAAMGVLVDFGAMIGRVWPLLAGGAAIFIGLQVATMGWAGALGFLLSPAVLIAAGIAAIVLIVDDLIVAFQGGESVIANFFESFFGWDIQPALQGIVDFADTALGYVTDLANKIMDSFGAIFSGIGKLLSGNFMDGLSDINAGLNAWAGTVAGVIKDMFGGAFDWAKDKISGLIPDWMMDLVGGDSGNDGQKTGAPAELDASLRAGGSSMAQDFRQQTTNQEVRIDVRTSDPVKAGQITADLLQRQMEDAQTQSNRGGS